MRILVTGVTGQDGRLLVDSLYGDMLECEVFGLVRGQDNPRQVLLDPRVKVLFGDMLDGGSLTQALIDSEPDAVINLAGVTSPGFAWSQQLLTAEINALGVTRLLEAVRQVCGRDTVVVQAGSVAKFGPYGASKEFARIAIADARARGMHATCLEMVGHHSPLRSPMFFSQKVVQGAVAIAEGRQEHLNLGPLTRLQDWGWANNFTDAMVGVLHVEAGEYTLGTNDPRPLQEWVEQAFAYVGLDWREHVKQDMTVQPYDVGTLTAQSSRISGWEPNLDFVGLVEWMVDHERGLR